MQSSASSSKATADRQSTSRQARDNYESHEESLCHVASSVPRHTRVTLPRIWTKEQAFYWQVTAKLQITSDILETTYRQLKDELQITSDNFRHLSDSQLTNNLQTTHRQLITHKQPTDNPQTVDNSQTTHRHLTDTSHANNSRTPPEPLPKQFQGSLTLSTPSQTHVHRREFKDHFRASLWGVTGC